MQKEVVTKLKVVIKSRSILMKFICGKKIKRWNFIARKILSKVVRIQNFPH
jgi:hypothetical protein